jgi:hypothetical protein
MNLEQLAVIDAKIEELIKEKEKLNERLLEIPEIQNNLITESSDIMIKLLELENQISVLEEEAK